MPNTSLLIVSTHNAAQHVFSEEPFKQQTYPSSDDEQMLQRQQPHMLVLAVVRNIAAEQMKFNSMIQQWGPFDWSLGGGERGQEHWSSEKSRSTHGTPSSEAQHLSSATPQIRPHRSQRAASPKKSYEVLSSVLASLGLVQAPLERFHSAFRHRETAAMRASNRGVCNSELRGYRITNHLLRESCLL